MSGAASLSRWNGRSTTTKLAPLPLRPVRPAVPTGHAGPRTGELHSSTYNPLPDEISDELGSPLRRPVALSGSGDLGARARAAAMRARSTQAGRAGHDCDPPRRRTLD
jgi:hypothetical protein